MVKRRKLFDGAIIIHSDFGYLKIMVSHRENVLHTPDLWEAFITKDSHNGLRKANTLAVPSAYTEIKLHKFLKYYGKYTFAEDAK